MPVVVIPRNPSTATSSNVLVDNATFTSTPPVDPGTITGDPIDPSLSGLAIRIVKNTVTGRMVLCPVGAHPDDKPQSFYGFLTGAGGTGIVVATGRGSIVTPCVEGSVPLIPDVDVYLARTPGYVTQDTDTSEDHAQLRVGVAIDTTRIVLAPDFRLNYF